MKKRLLFAAILSFIALNYLNSQVIANFEPTGPLTLHVMGNGNWDNADLHPVSETFMVVDNPDPSGINTSAKVMKFIRRGTTNGGFPWGGFWANCYPPFDVSTYKYVHVKVWKSKISPIKFKLEGGTSGTLEILSMNAQPAANMWVDMVFDFSTMEGTYPIIAFMPDFEDPLTQVDDIEIFFDDIIVSDDPTPITAESMIANFEDNTSGPLTLHVMGCGDWDNVDLHPVSETFMIIDNPDISGINTSSKVMKFMRRGTNDGGFPWGGFWANADPNVDVTINKYVHVKVWKPRISPVKFKIQGGTAGDLEIASMNVQPSTNQWVDMVFDFSTMTGMYPVVSFMPDFEDPLTQADILEIYFDDIRINTDPNPRQFAGNRSVEVVVDFEGGTTGPLTLHVMGCGDWDNPDLHPVTETFTIVDNPDQSGINKSSKVMKFIRRGTNNGGFPWGGFWAGAVPNIDVTTNKYVHVKVWKTRISPVKFKLEGGTTGTLEIFSKYEQSATNRWVDMVFDFTTLTGPYPTVAFMPDFEDPLTQTDDLDIYFDDIIFNNDSTPILPPPPVIANFEDGTAGPLTLHVMGCGDWDNAELHPVTETFTIVDNPDPSGINTSTKVMKFIRRGTNNSGSPWGGFWASADPNVDVTDYKYVHAKVWKPRISPAKFKLEGGTAGTLEIFSIIPQEATNQWVDMVFDFTTKTGTYPTIAFMPDFEDPLTQVEDIEIYLDDILINNEAPSIGINDLEPFTFSIYPNPSDGIITIENTVDLMKVTVFNMMGQEVMNLKQIPAGKIDINLENQINGLYFITLTDLKGRSSSAKVIKR